MMRMTGQICLIVLWYPGWQWSAALVYLHQDDTQQRHSSLQSAYLQLQHGVTAWSSGLSAPLIDFLVAFPRAFTFYFGPQSPRAARQHLYYYGILLSCQQRIRHFKYQR
jgi:hypothetical protein